MKIALVRRLEKSSWVSCQSITENLQLSYEKIKVSSLQVLSLEECCQKLGSLENSKKCFKENVDVISFIDHEPFATNFLWALEKTYRNSDRKPRLVFHLFGDFMLQISLWKQCLEVISSFDCQFVCASHKQAELFSKMIDCDKACLKVIPFSVDEAFYAPDIDKRNKTRKQLGVAKNECVFFYSGRLSYQKNVIELISAFNYFKKNMNSKSKLILAGPMDDLGAPYIGKEALPGTYYSHWHQVFKENVTKDVSYVGNLKPNDLINYYQASDCFVSLSAHNDEDYGMAVAEALCCGKKAILSEWGGHISFHHYFKNSVQLTPLNLSAKRMSAKLPSFVKSLVSFDCSQSDNDILINSQLAHKEIGLQSVSTKIEQCLIDKAGKIIGITEMGLKMSSLFETSAHAVFRSVSGEYSQFYFEVYNNYANPHLESL